MALLINLNSRIVNSVSPDLTWQFEQFRLGQDRFAAREPMAACTNAEQERGWWSALKASSDADTDAYLRGGAR